MHRRSGSAVFAILVLAGMLALGAVLPFSRCPNCSGSGRAEFDIDQDWCGKTGDDPIVETDPGWTTPCARCRARGRLTMLQARKGMTPTLKAPSIPPSDVLRLFRLRSSPKDLAQFEQLRASSRSEDRLRALELVLVHLTDKELFELSITESGARDNRNWAVYWSDDSVETMDAVEATLRPLGISAGGSMGHGSAGWYVDQKEFFAARRALLASPEIRGRRFLVVTPKFRLD